MNISIGGMMGSGKSFITGMIKKNLDMRYIQSVVLEADKIFKSDICYNPLFIKKAQQLTNNNAYIKNGDELVYNKDFFKENLFTDLQFYKDYNRLIEPFLSGMLIELFNKIPKMNYIVELAVPTPSIMGLCDYNISVFSNDEIAQARVKKRNPEYSYQYIKTVRKFQNSLHDKRLADFYFDNCSDEMPEHDLNWCVGLFTGESN